MRASEALALHRSRIREIALSHRVRNVRVFGSAARGEDGDASDLNLLGIEIDVLTPGALPETIRAQVLREAWPV